MRKGWIRIPDIQHMTLDDVDLWCLYLDALEEAEYRATLAGREGEDA